MKMTLFDKFLEESKQKENKKKEKSDNENRG